MQVALCSLGIEVGIVTGDDEVNAMGTLPPAEARILLATQAKLRASHRHHDRFDEMQGVFYRGAATPRQDLG